MAGLIPRSDINTAKDIFTRSMTESGISTDAGKGSVASTIKDAIIRTLQSTYGMIYELSDNLMITEATGRFLDRYGELLAESRSKEIYAKDYSFSNTYIMLYGKTGLTAGSITVDGSSIRIPANTRLSSPDGGIVVTTISETTIPAGSDKGYCQVRCTNATVSTIPARTLLQVGYNLSEIANIDLNSISGLSLRAGNERSISGGYKRANDNEYRYILTKKGEALGTANRSSIEKAMLRVPDLVRFTIREFTHGNSSVSVFIESKDLVFPAGVLRTAQAAIQNAIGMGTRVFIFQPILRSLQIIVKITSEPSLTSIEKQNIVAAIKTYVNNIPTGNGVTVNQILTELQKNMGRSCTITIKKIYLGNRELLIKDISLRYNEKLVMNANDSIIFI